MQIKDNVFVVTGGASGLSAATAKMILERGGKVVISLPGLYYLRKTEAYFADIA